MANQKYYFDTDGDFMQLINSGCSPSIKLYMCVRLKNKDDFSRAEITAIRTCIRFGERGTSASKEAFVREWYPKLRDNFDNVSLQNEKPNQKAIIISPKASDRVDSLGRIKTVKMYVQGSDWIVVFKTDLSLNYAVSILHKLVGDSYSVHQGKAFSEVLAFAMVGEKMDESIFLQQCSRLKQKFNLVRVSQQSNVLVAHITPTTLSEEDSGVLFTSRIPLPAVTVGDIDWSPSAKQRISTSGSVHKHVTCDVCGVRDFAGIRYKCLECIDYDLCPSCFHASKTSKNHRKTHSVRPIEAPLAAQPDQNIADLGALLAQLLNVDPLELERNREEEVMKNCFEDKKEVVGSVVYLIDSDGDFTMVLTCASEPRMQMILCVKIADKKNLSWQEVRAIVQCLTVGERGTAMSVATFIGLEEKLRSKVEKVWLQQSQSQSNRIVLVLKPAKVESSFSAGKIVRSYIEKDGDGDFAVHFENDMEQFTIVVKHVGKYNSFGKIEENALRDAISLSEPGDKMDPSMFKKYCSRLKRKYHLVKVTEVNKSKLAAFIVPTLLPQEKLGDMVKRMEGIPLPPASDSKIDWFPETMERIANLPREARPLNRVGIPMSLGTDYGYRDTYYCGRFLGVANIPGSDGRCGPTNGPQCADCLGSTRTSPTPQRNPATPSPPPQPSPPQRFPVTPPQQFPLQPPAHGSPPNHFSPNHLNSQLPHYNNGKIYATILLKNSGQADVYEGVRVSNDSSTVEVALKIFRSEDDWNDCKVELMTLLRAGGHANVMEVLDFFEKPKPCMVMRLVRGGDLMDYLEKHGALKVDVAVSVLRGIALGLQHLHSHGIAHRDMKSPNILLQLPSMDPVLIDLGMGKFVGSGSVTAHTTGAKGTLLWMAPEMMTDNLSGRKIDIYALGIIMWEIFSGQVPFNEYNFGNFGQFVLHVGIHNKRPSIDVVRRAAGVKPGHVALIQKCWVADPDNRPTATEFLQELEGCR